MAAKGEYRGLSYRNNADLQAWLAKRPSEAALACDQYRKVKCTLRCCWPTARAMSG